MHFKKEITEFCCRIVLIFKLVFLFVIVPIRWRTSNSPGAKLENGGLPYTESPLSFDGFN